MTQTEKRTATPTVTIGMPVYNGEKYIREALDSVLAQTFTDFELIISDNASTDKTQEICLTYAKADPRIKYIRQDKNHGPLSNFNFVTQEARGPLFAWLAHDDILEPSFLEESVRYMSTKPSAVLAVGDFKIINDDAENSKIEELSVIRDDIAWKRRRLEFFKHPPGNVFFSVYGLMRTDSCKSIMQSMAVPKFFNGLEQSILARFAVIGEIASVRSVWRTYRIHTSSLCRSEGAEISKKTTLHRVVIRIQNGFRLNFDNLFVLLASGLSPRNKTEIAAHMLTSWTTSLFSKLNRLR